MICRQVLVLWSFIAWSRIWSPSLMPWWSPCQEKISFHPTISPIQLSPSPHSHVQMGKARCQRGTCCPRVDPHPWPRWRNDTPAGQLVSFCPDRGKYQILRKKNFWVHVLCYWVCFNYLEVYTLKWSLTIPENISLCSKCISDCLPREQCVLWKYINWPPLI